MSRRQSILRPEDYSADDPPLELSYGARRVLDAVERWAVDCFLLRETCVLRDGRLDGLLIPVSWTSPMKCGLYAVEVKISRSDFLRGLNGKQFDRYLAMTNGLYVATYPGVCKTTELPHGVGHLIVNQQAKVAVCRRKATRRTLPMDEGILWRILYDAFDQQRKQLRREREIIAKTVKHIGYHIGDRLVKAAENVERMYREPVAQIQAQSKQAEREVRG
jgi:hypothetical protein